MTKKIKISGIAVFAIVIFLMMMSSASAFGPSTLYTSPNTDPSPGTLYPRALTLKYSGSYNGRMLATFEHYVSGTPSFPIYQSTDGGVTWTHLSEVTDQVNGWGLRYQPFLYELPQAIGNMPAGTLLIAGNSIPSNLATTKLDMYKSTDHGVTWTFVSTQATGGKADPSGAYDPVWEPFLLVANNKLIYYYSDERDPLHNQKLVHITSTDGINWSSAVEDISLADSTKRPGMTTVAKLGNGSYIMTYEYGGASPGFAVYYKISTNPENFGAATDPGTQLITQDGVKPSSSPYVTWLSGTGPNGTIAVRANSSSELYVNTENGASNTWTRVSTAVAGGYSPALVPLADNHNLFILNGGPLGSTNHNSVTYGSIDLGDAALLHQWESFSVPGSYMRHYNFAGRIDPTPLSNVDDSKFRMVPGLSNSSGVSFESLNFPGYYLRHYNYVLQVARNDGTATFKDDATFTKVAGLGDATKVSFQSYNYPTRYIRTLNSILRIDPISTTQEKNDATWIQH